MATTSLKEGLTKKVPPACDASTKLTGKSVNADATRKSVAPHDKTLGPRTA